MRGEVPHGPAVSQATKATVRTLTLCNARAEGIHVPARNTCTNRWSSDGGARTWHATGTRTCWELLCNVFCWFPLSGAVSPTHGICSVAIQRVPCLTPQTYQ